MGYASATERDGKRVYTITEEGRQFLAERKDLADEVKSQMRHHWNPENINVIREMLDEFSDFGKLVRRRLRYLNSEKMKRIREVVSRARQEVEAILEE
jgi:DNA-binding PadR family transcriptional regulator